MKNSKSSGNLMSSSNGNNPVVVNNSKAQYSKGVVIGGKIMKN